MSAAVAEGFVRRGFPPARAALLAVMTAAALRLAYEDWLSDEAPATIAERFARLASDMKAVLES